MQLQCITANGETKYENTFQSNIHCNDKKHIYVICIKVAMGDPNVQAEASTKASCL